MSPIGHTIPNWAYYPQLDILSPIGNSNSQLENLNPQLGILYPIGNEIQLGIAKLGILYPVVYFLLLVL